MDPEDLFTGPLSFSRPRETSENQGLSRAWIRCPSGRRLDILDPSPLDVEIGDIALSLSRISRWAGMTDRPFSVAQHCILVTQILRWRLETSSPLSRKVTASGWPRRAWLLAALCHDAPEAYLGGDLCGPAKSALTSDGYPALEARLEKAVHLRFELPAVLPALMKKAIKEADRASAYVEAILVAGFTKKEADMLFGVRTNLSPSADLPVLNAREAEARFLKQFSALTA